MNNDNFPTQDELLRAAGLDGIPAGPRRDFIANKISNDNEVLLLADKLAREHFKAKAIEQMAPAQRARLVKRSQPEPVPGAGEYKWCIGQATQTQQWHILCAAPIRDFGDGTFRPAGESSYTGKPENVAHWRPFGQTVPQEIVAEYKRVYTGPLTTDSKQGEAYARLMTQPRPDFSKVPGPDYDHTRP